MPYPTEHAARMKAPGDFEQGSFRRENDKMGSGIHAIFGKLKGQDTMTIQALRFSKTKWTMEQAKKWLSDHGYKPIMFEPAMDKQMTSKFSQLTSVPSTALRFSMCEFELSESNGEGAKSAPLKMVARSGQSIDHGYWGKVVHDMQGMRLNKNRVAVDFNHDANQVIGYLNHFDVSSGDLVASGALVPYKTNDMATEIIHKSKQGVPYEASIFFGGGPIAIEEVADGVSCEVNGKEFTGPGIIFREWPLRGVAICPYGADQNTSSELSEKSEVGIRFSTAGSDPEYKESIMSDATVEAAKAAEEAKKAEEAKAAELAAVEAEKQKQNDPVNMLKQKARDFKTAFGDQGIEWFLADLTFEQAQTKFAETLKVNLETLRKENSELKLKLDAISKSGETTPAGTSTPAAEGDTGKKTFRQLCAEKAKELKCTLAQAGKIVAQENPEAWSESKKSVKTAK